MIYFDHNSTSSYSPSVREYLGRGMLEEWYNPSSVYSHAQTLHQKMNVCRKYIADYLNCSSKYLFFTSGATESINTVLSFDTLKLNQLSACISSSLEHYATIKKLDYLLGYQGIKTYWVFNNTQGEISFEDLEKICTKYPYSLLSFLSANNETGVITDIKNVVQIAKKYNCLVHVDAGQSLGKMAVDLEEWNVDFASFSGHKIGAMKGVGLLYAKKPFQPLLYGGGQEKGLRSGTYNYPTIESFKLAVQDIDLSKNQYVRELRDYFENRLCQINDENQKEVLSSPFKVNCKKAHRLPNTSNIYCGGISHYVILSYLNRKGICVSAGSACNAGAPAPSHVIKNLNIEEDNEDYAQSCIRISLSASNTKKEIDFLIESLRELYTTNYQSSEMSL